MASLRFFSRFSIIAVVFPLLLAGCISESDLIMVKRDLNSRMDVMEDRLSRVESKDDSDLRGEIENLQKRQVELHNSMEEIRENTQDITGSLESKVMRLQRTNQTSETNVGATGGEVETMRQEISQLTARVNELERILGTESRSSSGKSSAPAPQAAPAPKVAESKTSYDTALDLYKEQRYEAAQKMFERFIAENPKSSNADNAQFWIGECLYKRGDYGKAILEYQKVVEKYASGNKVPDALLKQALAFKAMGDKTSAKILLEKVIRQFANSPQAQTAKTELSKL